MEQINPPCVVYHSPLAGSSPGTPPCTNRSVYWSVFTPDILHMKVFNFQNFLPTVNVHDVYSASMWWQAELQQIYRMFLFIHGARAK